VGIRDRNVPGVQTCALPISFLNKGAKVVGMDIHKNAMIDLQKNFEETFEFVIGSVRQKTDVQSLVHQAMERFEKIDILLNTAGVLDNYRKTLKTDEALWDQIMDTNLKGMYYVTNAVLPHMLKQEKGTIVNMASIAGFVAGGGGAAYTASKHGIIGYTKQLDYDYCREGI